MKSIWLAIVFVFAVVPARADIVYQFDMSAGALTATGTITTDGYIGIFPETIFGRATHIANYNITLSDGIHTDNINSDYDHIGGITGLALIATPTELRWNFDAPNSLFDMFTGLAMTELGFGAGVFAMQIYDSNIGVVAEGTQYYSGVQTIASIETPLPGALVLFMSGISLFAFFRRIK
jgi:hypothetical protein